ncbi:MAG: TetR/AcrR family transcriptional regulator, partial [Sciscionella sp.]
MFGREEFVAGQAPLRRRPVQQRSTQRVERMLNACADLIDELGYDGVTTTLIAE